MGELQTSPGASASTRGGNLGETERGAQQTFKTWRKQTQPDLLINLEGERTAFLGQQRSSPRGAASSHVIGMLICRGWV